MARLKNKNKQIPNGFTYYDAALKWTAPRGASFHMICECLRNARLANPGVTRSKNLAIDPTTIEQQVEDFNVKLCEQHGWNDYLDSGTGGPQVPFPQPQRQQFRRLNPLQKLVNVVGGTEPIVEWIASGAEAVPQEQANHRAEVCSKCPLNEKGGWERWFTVPVSNAIQAAVKQKEGFKLATPFDEHLGSCAACTCPMTLKVWMPFDKFYPKMPEGQREALHTDCWIRSEQTK